MSFDPIDFTKTLNGAWQAQDFEALANLFSAHAILQPPDVGPPIIGRASIVSTYREFAENATVIQFVELDLNTFDFTSTVIVHLNFEIEYKVDTIHRIDSGLEVYVIEKAPAQIIWRQQTITHSRDITEPV